MLGDTLTADGPPVTIAWKPVQPPDDPQLDWYVESCRCLTIGDASWFLQEFPPRELGYVLIGTTAAQLWARSLCPRLDICLVGHDADSADAFLERVAPRFGHFLQSGSVVDFSSVGSSDSVISIDCRLWPDIHASFPTSLMRLWRGTVKRPGGLRTRLKPSGKGS